MLADWAKQQVHQLMEYTSQDHIQLVWGWGSKLGWQNNGLPMPDGDLPLRQDALSQGVPGCN